MSAFKKVFPLSFKLGNGAKGFVWSIVLHTVAKIVATVAFMVGVAVGTVLLLPSIFILPLLVVELLVLAFLVVLPAILSMYATIGCGLSIMKICGLIDAEPAETEKAE